MNRRQFSAVLPAAALAGMASHAATAQTKSAHPLNIDRFDHMSVNVGDFDAALAWYRDILGLTVDVSWKVGALNGKQLAYLSLNGTRVLEIVAADANGTASGPRTPSASTSAARALATSVLQRRASTRPWLHSRHAACRPSSKRKPTR